MNRFGSNSTRCKTQCGLWRADWRRRPFAGALALVLVLAAWPVAAEYDPPAVYLTWQQDPATTMTVHWHTFESEGREARLEYQTDGAEEWRSAGGDSKPFPFSDPQRIIHTAELTGLEPATRHHFRFGADSKTYAFRTMPQTLEQPVRFATGGDLHHEMETFGKMNRAAARMNLDFVVFGGDLAYANGCPRRVDQWYTFLEVAKETLVNPDGRLIPMLMAVGNHEIFAMRRLERDNVTHLNDEWGLEEGDAPFYMALFAFPGEPAYGVLDFGDYLSILLLDTSHYSPMEGAQTEWLARTLTARREVPHVFPFYHVPGYPSVRPWEGITNTQVRELWAPLFEGNNVRLAFENHDHAFKRTHPLRQGAIHPDGVVYLGDGAWGVGVREPSVAEGTEDWYLVHAAPLNHGFVVTLYADQRHVVAIDNEGRVIDEVYQRLN
jgi:acid phosphatase type 7